MHPERTPRILLKFGHLLGTTLPMNRYGNNTILQVFSGTRHSFQLLWVSIGAVTAQSGPLGRLNNLSAEAWTDEQESNYNKR
jgi:hypothetical protein